MKKIICLLLGVSALTLFIVMFKMTNAKARDKELIANNLGVSEGKIHFERVDVKPDLSVYCIFFRIDPGDWTIDSILARNKYFQKGDKEKVVAFLPYRSSFEMYVKDSDSGVHSDKFVTHMNPTSRSVFPRPPQCDASTIRRFCKAKPLAIRLGLCPRTIFRWADRGMITRHKINARVVLFDEVEVIAFIESARVGCPEKGVLSV